MKYFLYLAIGLMTASCASLKQVSSTVDSYEQVFEIPGISKDDLYLRASTWFVKTFNNAESVIQFSDKEGGRIVGRYVADTDRKHYGEWSLGDWIISSQIIVVDIKDSRIRIEISQPTFDPAQTALTYADAHAGIKEPEIDLRPMWNELTKSLNNYVKNEEPNR